MENQTTLPLPAAPAPQHIDFPLKPVTVDEIQETLARARERGPLKRIVLGDYAAERLGWRRRRRF